MNLGKKIILGLLVIIVFQEAIAKGKQIDMDSTSVKFEWNFYSSPFTKSGMTPEENNQIDEMAEFVSKFPNDKLFKNIFISYILYALEAVYFTFFESAKIEKNLRCRKIVILSSPLSL